VNVPVLDVFDYTVRDGDGDTSTATNQIHVTDVLNRGENLLVIEAPAGVKLLFGDAGSSNMLDGAPLVDGDEVLTFIDILRPTVRWSSRRTARLAQLRRSTSTASQIWPAWTWMG
jgi:hypothetical protein